MQVVRDIIERLEIYRLENRITQEALAKRLGVAFSTVNRWFNRRSNPSKIQAYHIEKLLKNASKRGRKKRKP
jgi:transcriptional regulator with XRE-family HTH domain